MKKLKAFTLKPHSLGQEIEQKQKKLFQATRAQKGFTPRNEKPT